MFQEVQRGGWHHGSSGEGGDVSVTRRWAQVVENPSANNGLNDEDV